MADTEVPDEAKQAQSVVAVSGPPTFEPRKTLVSQLVASHPTEPVLQRPHHRIQKLPHSR